MSGLYLSTAEVTAGADNKPTAFSWAKTRPAWRKKTWTMPLRRTKMISGLVNPQT